MKEDIDEKRDYSVLWPFLVGGVIGAGLGLMFAPKSGKQLREDIADLAARGKEKVSTTIDESRTILEKSKNAVVSAIDCGKTAFQEEKPGHIKAA